MGGGGGPLKDGIPAHSVSLAACRSETARKRRARKDWGSFLVHVVRPPVSLPHVLKAKRRVGGWGGASRYSYLGKRLAAPAKPVGTYAKAWQSCSWAHTWKSGNTRLRPLEDRQQNIRDCVSGNSPDPETTPGSIGSRTGGRIVAVAPISYDGVLAVRKNLMARVSEPHRHNTEQWKEPPFPFI